LLPFDEALTHYLIDRRFDKRGADGVALPIPFPKVENELLTE
jgi:hypothetical protein